MLLHARGELKDVFNVESFKRIFSCRVLFEIYAKLQAIKLRGFGNGIGMQCKMQNINE